MTNNIRGIVLAGGNGTRLRPLTSDTPKPLLPVGDKRMIERALSYLVAGDVTDAVLIIQESQREKFEETIGDGRHLGLTSIQYAYNDDVGQGIPYAVGQAQQFVKPNERLMLVCGDILFDPGYVDAMKNAQKLNGAVIFTAFMEDTAGFGLLRVDGNEVVEVCTKDKSRHLPGHIELGTCLLPSNVFEKVQKLEAPERELGFAELYRLYLDEERLFCSSVSGWWSDGGNSLDEYRRVCVRFEG